METESGFGFGWCNFYRRTKGIGYTTPGSSCPKPTESSVETVLCSCEVIDPSIEHGVGTVSTHQLHLLEEVDDEMGEPTLLLLLHPT